jgi:hypothetical protein
MPAIDFAQQAISAQVCEQFSFEEIFRNLGRDGVFNPYVEQLDFTITTKF